MTILDTNFILSLFNQADGNHEKAKDIFFSLDEDEKIKIPFIVAAELTLSEDSGKILEASKAICSKFLVSSEEDLAYISKMPVKTKRKLKANDCLLIALCKRYDAELLTFDKSLKNQKKKFQSNGQR